MARTFPNTLILPAHKLFSLPVPIGFLVVLAAVFAAFFAVTLLCGSHSGWTRSLRGREGKRTVRLGGDRSKPRMMEKMKSSLSRKALLMAKMISWQKVQDGGDAEEYGGSVYVESESEEEDDVVWKKAIIRGEKCRPIEFSGKILYDCDGNRLPD